MRRAVLCRSMFCLVSLFSAEVFGVKSKGFEACIRRLKEGFCHVIIIVRLFRQGPSLVKGACFLLCYPHIERLTCSRVAFDVDPPSWFSSSMQLDMASISPVSTQDLERLALSVRCTM